MKPTIPKWLLEREKCTAREWKQRKRREIQVVIDALHAVNLGAAYAPTVNGVHIGIIWSDLLKLKLAWSQKEWGK